MYHIATISMLSTQTKEGLNAADEVVIEEDVFWEAIEPSIHESLNDRSKMRPSVPVTGITYDNYGLGWSTGYYRGT